MPHTTTIESRLKRLELTNKLLVLVALLGIAFGARSTADHDEVLRARSIELLDSQGLVAARLAFEDGNPGLYVMDTRGRVRAALFHSTDATGLYVNDKDEVTRIGVAQFAHGGGGVALHGPESKGAAVLYFKEAGSLRFFDADGKVTNSLSATPE